MAFATSLRFIQKEIVHLFESRHHNRFLPRGSGRILPSPLNFSHLIYDALDIAQRCERQKSREWHFVRRGPRTTSHSTNATFFKKKVKRASVRAGD